MEALVWYMYAASGFLVMSTWLRAIKRGNFETWPGLTYSNPSKYFPRAVETMKGHMLLSSQVVISINKKTIPPLRVKVEIFKDAPEEEDLEYLPPPITTNELYIWDKPISKLYTGDCGRFPIQSRNGSKYIMIAYHCDSNTIIQAPFANRKDKHRI